MGVPALLLTILLINTICSSSSQNLTFGVFPRNFKFGVATSSYQIEGGWNEDGKGENIWDHICHTNPDFIHNRDNGDVACDSYHQWRRDVKMIEELGVDFYRFSLSWSRILPTGFANKTNSKGLTYYKNIIETLLDKGIEPVVTLYHWDLPQPLEEIGGWLNPDIEQYFTDFARVAFESYGHLVKTWITINEPKQICRGGYGEGNMAPGIVSSGQDEYICGHNLIKAHARAWHLYNDEFRSTQNGTISITVDGPWFEPASDNPKDIDAAERGLQFVVGQYANPIFNRNYPQVMIDRIGNRSETEGLPKSRLPTFTEQELDYISGTHDFFGINIYTSVIGIGKTDEEPVGEISFMKDLNIQLAQDPSWPASEASPTFKVVPWGLRKLLNWIKDTYNNPVIIITENGFVNLGTSTDLDRINYFETYLKNLLDAMLLDNVRCSAYTAWSLMDNFEWGHGYSAKYGIYSVDFDDTMKPRTKKLSAYWYTLLAKTHLLIYKN